MTNRQLGAICVAALALASSATAQSTVAARRVLPAALERAEALMASRVQSGAVGGMLHRVWLDGEIVHDAAAGLASPGGQPFAADTIVRIYSMTKPITTVAAMRLHEQGQFELDDPVAKFIPAYASVTVFSPRRDGTFERQPTARPLTVRDLMRHTAGYGYVALDQMPLQMEYVREGLFYGGHGNPFDPKGTPRPPRMTIADAAERLARVPLRHQPGERFTYGFGTDLLGRLVEIWSEQPLDEHLAQTLFVPLGMDDTGFRVPPAKRDRIACCYTHEDGTLTVLEDGPTSPHAEGFAFLSGGGGLLSTLDDYTKFLAMLARGGEAGGVRYLSEESLDVMTTDQLDGAASDRGRQFRFGLGFSIRTVRLGRRDRAERCGWSGIASTDFHLVPEANLFQIAIRQHVPSEHALAWQLFDVVYDGVR